jgi:chorismate lyase / 3-hydroxybenzoate synthase
VTTTGVGCSQTPRRSSLGALEPEPPAWVRDLFGSTAVTVSQHCGELVEMMSRDRFVRLTTRIPDAEKLTAVALSEQVTKRYAAITQTLAAEKKHAVRFWNFVPGIGAVLRPGLDRYMAFNRGRYDAYEVSMEDIGSAGGAIPTASTVGIAGPDLVIECVASAERGTPVENPRQRSSWRYSRRYGPRPPCFARATRVTLGGRRVLLLGGTASIVGEDSKHPGDLKAQVDELLLNMTTLLQSAGAMGDAPLERLTDVRVYVVNADDAEFVEAAIQARSGPSTRMEIAVAGICRPELLVEVEGVASLPSEES